MGLSRTPSYETSQKEYLNSQDQKYLLALNSLNENLPPMKDGTKLVVCMPVYSESGIEETLCQFTINQKWEEKEIDPSIVEINILLNAPNGVVLDSATRVAVQKFQRQHPHFSINLVEKNFPTINGKAPIGEIFKTVTDLGVLRNSERKISEKEKKKLIFRSSGADVLNLSPHFLEFYIKQFKENPNLIASKGEYRMKTEEKEKYPMIYALDTFTRALVKIINNRKFTNGGFCFLADKYAEVGGFNMNLVTKEDIQLAKSFYSLVGKNTDLKFSHNATTSPLGIESQMDTRRHLHALLNNIPYFYRYENFGDIENENAVRSEESVSPQDIDLTIGRLSEELSIGFQLFIKNLKTNKEKRTRIIKMERALFFLGFSDKDYSIKIADTIFSKYEIKDVDLDDFNFKNIEIIIHSVNSLKERIDAVIKKEKER